MIDTKQATMLASLLENAALTIRKLCAEVESHRLRMPGYDVPINFDLMSVRSTKACQSLGIHNLGELSEKTPEELLACKHFGITSLHEIRDVLKAHGMSLTEDT